jgi:hypothetical protein
MVRRQTMTKRLTSMVLMLAGAVSVSTLAGCDDAVNGGDPDADGFDDADGDAHAGLVCTDDRDDWACCQADRDDAQLRITSFSISTPSMLTRDVSQDFIDYSTDHFRFLWLIAVTFDDSGATMTTGAGEPVDAEPYSLEEFCTASWSSAYPPAEGVAMTVKGDGLSTASPIESITVPIFDSDGNELFELPLSQVSLTNLTFNEGHTLVGAPTAPAQSTELAASWTGAAVLSGWLSWDAAQRAGVGDSLGVSVCELFCGVDCSTVTDPTAEAGGCSHDATLDRRPSELPGPTPAQLGWQLTATIGAGAITIR